MPITPDRRPGDLDESGIYLRSEDDFGNPVVDPIEEGGITYHDGGFAFRDATGVYNPRTSGSGITEEQHKILRQLIHFIEEGPAEGFTSGAYKETTGTLFPTSEIWWESSNKLKKIVSLDTTWTGTKITQEVWKIYATDGTTALATITDDISYSGVFETSRTRTIAVT